MPRRKTLLIALALAGTWYGWGRLSERIEVVTLFVSGAGVQDHYTRLWVVDDGEFAYLRVGADGSSRIFAAARQVDTNSLTRPKVCWSRFQLLS